MGLVGKVWRGFYADSITLMQVAEEVRRHPGVLSAELLMATPANRAMLADAGMWPADADGAGATDLVLAVRAESAAPALARAEELLTRRRPSVATGLTPSRRSITSAVRTSPDANLAVISVPGSHAASEAQQALSSGLHVFLFSDGVALADEVALKRRARGLDLLVMGPECGTSILGGVGVGFANVVRRGAIGLVGASGTGLQEITCLIDALGGGVSHAIGTGGRDLHDAVEGITSVQALRCLAADVETRAIVLVSKPASPRVADVVLGAAAAAGKPVIACLLGWRGATPVGVRRVETLEAAALAALRAVGGCPAELARPDVPCASRPRGPQIHGFYTGGTLCEEARRLVGDGPHRFVDFGADVYTRGRPHPMIDPAQRNAAVSAAGDDAEVGVLLVDAVLGHGAHPDPATPLAAAIAGAKARATRAGRALDVVARVVGTDADPQARRVQEDTLRTAGAIVCPSHRLAAEVARDLAGVAHVR